LFNTSLGTAEKGRNTQHDRHMFVYHYL